MQNLDAVSGLNVSDVLFTAHTRMFTPGLTTDNIADKPEGYNPVLQSCVSHDAVISSVSVYLPLSSVSTTGST